VDLSQATDDGLRAELEVMRFALNADEKRFTRPDSEVGWQCEAASLKLSDRGEIEGAIIQQYFA
jgi:hypothetical protein